MEGTAPQYYATFRGCEVARLRGCTYRVLLFVQCTKLYDLSVRCLVALKMELRSHVYCFLGRPEAVRVRNNECTALFGSSSRRCCWWR